MPDPIILACSADGSFAALLASDAGVHGLEHGVQEVEEGGALGVGHAPPARGLEPAARGRHAADIAEDNRHRHRHVTRAVICNITWGPAPGVGSTPALLYCPHPQQRCSGMTPYTQLPKSELAPHHPDHS